MQKAKQFFIDATWSLVGVASMFAAFFILDVFIGRRLGVYDLGLYRLAYTIYGAAIIIPGFGVSTALIKYVAEYREELRRRNQIVTSGLVFGSVMGVVASFILFFSSGALSAFFDMPELKGLVIVLSFALPFATLHYLEVSLLNGLREMRSCALLSLIQNVLFLGLAISSVVIGSGVLGVIVGLVLSMLLSSLYGLFLITPFYTPDLSRLISNIKKVVFFGGYTVTGRVINEINYRADILLIAYFLSAENVGYYVVALSFSRFYWIIPQAVQRITYPAASEYWKKKDTVSLQGMIDKSMKYNSCILLPIGLFILFFAHDLVSLFFGIDFGQSLPPLIVLLIGGILDGATIRPVNSTLAGIGKVGIGVRIVSLAAALNIIANILLIPHLGISGAAIATTLSLVTVAAMNAYFIRKYAGIVFDVHWYLKLGALTLCSILGYVLFRGVNPYVVGGFIIVAFSVLVWQRLFTKEDHAYFFTLLKT